MERFKGYSSFYDSLYHDKDYKAEVIYIRSLFNSFSPHPIKDTLSLGCGTCSHDILLAKQGIHLTSVDRSPEMLAIAQEKINKNNLSQQIKLVESDIKDLSLESDKFDSAMAMFNIIGYQTTNQDVLDFFKNTTSLLKPGSIFLFDCWYAPAVLSDFPTDRVKQFTQNGQKIIRVTKSQLDHQKNIIAINFHTLAIEGKNIVTESQEDHPMRFFSLPELQFFLELSGLHLVKAFSFLDQKSPPSLDNWNIMIVAQKPS